MGDLDSIERIVDESDELTWDQKRPLYWALRRARESRKFMEPRKPRPSLRKCGYCDNPAEHHVWDRRRGTTQDLCDACYDLYGGTEYRCLDLDCKCGRIKQ